MSYRKKHINPRIYKLKKKRSIIKMPIFWIALICFTLIMTILYFTLFSDRFEVKNINISGNEKNSTEQITNLISNNIKKTLVSLGGVQLSTKSIFTVNSNQIITNLLKEFPNIESVQIQKKLPQSLTVKIKERSAVGSFCQNQTCFLIDLNGIIFEPQNSIPDNAIIVRQNLNNKEYSAGENAIEKNIMVNISDIQRNLKNNFEINIKEAVMADLLKITTSENWQIYFDPKQDVNLQIMKMNALLKTGIKMDDRKKLHYIYLQYKDRAYYQ